MDQESLSNSFSQASRKEPIALTIVALLLVVSGFFAFLYALVRLADFFLFQTTPNVIDLYSTLVFIFTIVQVAISVYLSIILIKISSALHRLEYDAYQSAFLVYVVVSISVVLSSIISFVLNQQILPVIGSLVITLIYVLLLLSLHSQKDIFVHNNVTSLKKKVMIALILFCLCMPIGIISQKMIADHLITVSNQQFQAQQQEIINKEKNVVNQLQQFDNSLKATPSASMTPKSTPKMSANLITPTPSSFQNARSVSNSNSYVDGLSSTSINGIPYYMIIGTYHLLNGNTLTIIANGSSYQIQLQKSTQFTNQDSKSISLSDMVLGDKVKTLANTKTGSTYPANYIQDLSR